jgi:arylformamidase
VVDLATAMRIRTDKMWDLSQPVAHDGPGWPDFDPPSIRRNYRAGADGFNAETVTMNTHTGTHVDVPFHFIEGGATVEEVPLEAFAAPALFVDLRDLLAPSQEIGPAELEERIGDLREGDFAVLVTGWGERRGNSDEFLKRWPYLGGAGARLLVDRGVSGVGIDALSVGGWGGADVGEPPHLELLGAGKVIVEELRIPAELLGRRAFLTAFPVKLEGCGGAWARAVAWELDED